MKSFIKRFHPSTPYERIRMEARFQRVSASLGLSPIVIRCNRNAIVMEHLQTPCLADVYGDDIDELPEWIQESILDILYTLYCHGIEYVDVTPYNFIEKDGVVWVLDFGHARQVGDEIESYLNELFVNWKLTKWNPDFL
jgi:RIO-like serine/threonine protein kinase